MQRKPYEKAANETINSGFGAKSAQSSNRIFDSKGKATVRKKGLSFVESHSLYHTLVDLSWRKFYFIISISYLIINLIFACIYYFLGRDAVEMVLINDTDLAFFSECFFFSTQTLTTVGYGHISPNSFSASLVAAIEAIIGVLLLAVATGLLYGRFVRPQSFIKFSNNLLVTPHKGIFALMFRMAPYKNTQLSESEIFVSMVLKVEENGVLVNKYYKLETEISKISTFILSWTIVHPINENSPIYGFDLEDLIDDKMELIIHLKSFDDKYSNIVVKNHSYTYEDLVHGAKFVPMFSSNAQGNATILDFNKLSQYELVL